MDQGTIPNEVLYKYLRSALTAKGISCVGVADAELTSLAATKPEILQPKAFESWWLALNGQKRPSFFSRLFFGLLGALLTPFWLLGRLFKRRQPEAPPPPPPPPFVSVHIPTDWKTNPVSYLKAARTVKMNTFTSVTKERKMA